MSEKKRKQSRDYKKKNNIAKFEVREIQNGRRKNLSVQLPKRRKYKI